MRNQVSGFKDTLPLSAIPGGRAPLNVHAAPDFLGHLGQQFQKFQKSFKFETQPQIED